MYENLDRRLKRAIRRDPHVREICAMLGVTVAEFLDGVAFDPRLTQQFDRAVCESAAALRAQSQRDALEEDLHDAVDSTARARAAVGASSF